MTNQKFNIGDNVQVLHAAHLPRKIVSSSGVIERITHQSSDGTPLYWVSGRATAVTARQLKLDDQTVTYTVSVTVTRPVRVYDSEDTLPKVAEWMIGFDAKRELEREILRALRVLDGDCDAEVMEVSASLVVKESR